MADCPPAESPAPQPGTPEIVVADDDRDGAEVLGVLLRCEGYDVHVAFDGVHALGLIRALRPRLALVDITMPGLDGYALAEALAALPGRSAMRVVALSGWGQAEARERARQAGFDHYFLKPVDPEALCRWIRDAVPLAGARPGTAV